jgi:sucrose-6-phosphate hydrolase SacC (GH32 family)
MTLPRRIGLRNLPEGPRLVQVPAETVRTLRRNRFSWRGARVADLNRALRAHPVGEASFELHATIPAGAGGESGWKLVSAGGAYVTVGYDPHRRELYLDRTHSGNIGFSPQFPARTSAPLRATGGALDLTILVDRSTLEVFAQRGEIAMSMLFYPPEGRFTEEFFAPANAPARITVERWDLRSTWNVRR